MSCRCSAGRRRPRADAGVSEKWKLRRGQLFLVPGDSPVGYRLPLGSLPYVPPSQYPYINPADPSEPTRRPARLRRTSRRRSSRAGTRAQLSPPPSRSAGPRRAGDSARSTARVRTAMSVEPRDGRLCVFMPPVERVEDYLELVAAAEAAARRLGLPVHIEGYAPPHDPRLNVIRVAPDPGVIEVNIHPGRKLGRMRRHHRRRSTRRRARPGSAPTSS